MASLSRSSRLMAGALGIMIAAAPMQPAWAHDSAQPDLRSASVAKQSGPVSGAACRKAGSRSGTLTCKKIKGKLVWVGTAASPVLDALCSAATYTKQVSNLTCTKDLVTFSSNGLPGTAFTTMVGITATNQQYPRTHSYQFAFPRTPSAASPTVPAPGPIGVAVDGVPLFSPWTQGALLEHTLDSGELDVCGGHAGRGDDYHYHVAPTCLINALGEHVIEDVRSPIGIANDGNPIRALGWFRASNSVEGQLDSCRGMRDASGRYFYNVRTTSKWDILDCFTNKVVNTSRDSWTSRKDSQGNAIIGAKVAMTITSMTNVAASGTTCSVMQGMLRNQQVIQSDQSVRTISGPVGIFYCDPACYAEFFEPTARFPGGSAYYELVTTRCPSGFNPASLPLLTGYTGPSLGKRQP